MMDVLLKATEDDVDFRIGELGKIAVKTAEPQNGKGYPYSILKSFIDRSIDFSLPSRTLFL